MLIVTASDVGEEHTASPISCFQASGPEKDRVPGRILQNPEVTSSRNKESPKNCGSSHPLRNRTTSHPQGYSRDTKEQKDRGAKAPMVQ
jgi:hypothetical protein